MYDESSETKYRQASAISSGVPRRPSGLRDMSAMPGTTLAGDIAGIHQGPPRLGLALDPDVVAGAVEWTATVQRGDPSDEDIEGLRLLFGDDFPVEELTRQGQILQDLK